MKKSNIPKNKVDTLNAPVNLTGIAHSIFCNVKNLLIGESPLTKDSDINQQLISDEELGLPANGIFSQEFNQFLKETIDNKKC